MGSAVKDDLTFEERMATYHQILATNLTAYVSDLLSKQQIVAVQFLYASSPSST